MTTRQLVAGSDTQQSVEVDGYFKVDFNSRPNFDFTQIDNAYLTSMLSSTEKCLLFLLIMHAEGGRGEVQIGHARLVAELGKSIETVKLTLRSLERLGVIRRVHRSVRSGKGRPISLTNIYLLEFRCPNHLRASGVTAHQPQLATSQSSYKEERKLKPQTPLHRSYSKVGEQLRKEYGAICLCCGGREEDGAVLTVDHVLPRSKGGSNALSNLQLLCATCNFTKGSQHLDFRNPDWQQGCESWSDAERVVREHLISQGKAVARHPAYQLPRQLASIILEWEARGYSAAAIERAVAEAASYRYPEQVELADKILSELNIEG